MSVLWIITTIRAVLTEASIVSSAEPVPVRLLIGVFISVLGTITFLRILKFAGSFRIVAFIFAGVLLTLDDAVPIALLTGDPVDIVL